MRNRMSRTDAALANDIELEEAALQGDMQAKGELRRRELDELARIEEERINNEIMLNESNYSTHSSDETEQKEESSDSVPEYELSGNDIMSDVILYGVIRGDKEDLGITFNKSLIGCDNCDEDETVLISDSEDYRSLVASLDSWGTIDCPDWGYNQHAIIHCSTCGHTELRFTD